MNNWIVGEYHAIGLNLQGISNSRIDSLKEELNIVKTRLENREYSNLNRQDLIGNLLFKSLLSLFSVEDAHNEAAAKFAHVVSYRQPSFGFFSTSMQISYWFGTPRTVSAPGLLMDIDLSLTSAVAKNNDHQLEVIY